MQPYIARPSRGMAAETVLFECLIDSKIHVFLLRKDRVITHSPLLAGSELSSVNLTC